MAEKAAGKVRPFQIGGRRIAPGSRQTVDLPVSVLSDHTPVTLSVHVVHGRRPGPVLFVSAAIHGDEVIGVEIVRRLLRAPNLDNLRGTLLAVPIVNAFGFLNQSRYLPDRRDLNRSFPGSARGSLAGRIANVFAREIVAHASHGIDLHTGGNHRTNLPHVRVSLQDREAERLARAFGASVIVNANLRDGSLRQYALEKGLTMLLYEAGEALRFDERAIATGLRGIVNVMVALEMLTDGHAARRRAPPAPDVALASQWIRAPQSGLMRTEIALGQRVARGEVLAHLADVAGENDRPVVAPVDGIVIGRCNLPAVHEGDALFHIASFGTEELQRPAGPEAASHIEGLQSGDYPGQAGR